MSDVYRKSIRDGIARVEIDLPGESVNVVSAAFRDAFDELLRELRDDTETKAVVLFSGKPDNWIAGADIEEFAALESRDQALSLIRNGQALVQATAGLGKPIVAAIHGAALGGGLEAALACTYRIATDAPETTLGLPEVQLGVIPGAGGCQRLPRLIGLQAALDIILAGKTVSASRGYRLGIVDDLVHPSILEDVASEAARKLIGGWRPTRTVPAMRKLTDGNALGRATVFRLARQQVERQTQGHFPAPLAALDAVEHGMNEGVTAGMEREAQRFSELAVGEVSRNLVSIFFATTELKKETGTTARDVAKLGVVGAGFMGAGIGGTAALRAGVQVRFKDADLDGVGRGIAAVESMLNDRLRKRRMSAIECRRKRALLSGGVDWCGFSSVDVVIEAVFEDLDVKRKVFSELEGEVPEDCILASNTSTIPIARIAEGMKYPERVLGMHFFSPVEKMPLLEVIETEQTVAWATATAQRFGQMMGKTVIVVRDRPGFWVNRILAPYLNEAGRLLEEGVEIEDIDRSMTRFGFPVGPITLLDEVGLDVAQKGSTVMFDAFGERLEPNRSIERMVADGRLGRKNGKGFYQYDKGQKEGVDSDVYGLLEIRSGTVPEVDVRDRLLFSLLTEAQRALSEGVVRSARDGNIGAIFGIGFPPFLGGPLRYLESLGADQVEATLARLQERYGDRFTPVS